MALQVVTSIIYVSAQVIALKSTFNAMFGIEQDDPTAVILMFIHFTDGVGWRFVVCCSYRFRPRVYYGTGLSGFALRH